MKKATKIGKILLDIIEVYLPIVFLLTLFASFIIGIFFRYCLQNPQSWSYELSSICFVSFIILSACFVQRTEQHIVFDMLFNKMTLKVQCFMRFVSNLIIAVICAILTPVSVKFVMSMKGLTSQVLKIPRGMIFVCFVILFLSTALRCAIRAFFDFRALKERSYQCRYGQVKEREE